MKTAKQTMTSIPVLVLGLALAGCNAPTSSGGLTLTGSGGSGGSGAITPTPSASASPGVFSAAKGFKLEVVPSSDYTFNLHDGLTDATLPCAVPSGTPIDGVSNFKSCTLEGAELDLWFRGVTFNYNAPAGMCAYVLTYPYWYFKRLPGYGPTDLEYTITDGVAGGYKVGGVAKVPGAATSFFDTDGNPSCASSFGGYDYSAFTGAGNCCVGSYTLTVTTVDTAAATSTVAKTKSSWGGAFSNCLGGAGVDLAAKSLSGRPISTITNVPTPGVNTAYRIPAPGSLSGGLSVTFYLASFFDTSAAYYNGSSPVAFDPIVPTSGPTWTPNPYYIFQCLDPADTVMASVKIQVRKWNLDEEFRKFLAGNPAADFHLSPDQNGFPSDNFPSWDDEAAAAAVLAQPYKTAYPTR